MRTAFEWFRIKKLQRSAVLFDDLFHDRQAKAGALFACRYIRFEQFRAIRWQSDTIVADVDRYSVITGHQFNP